MLEKVVSIRNVGRFKSSAAADNPELSRYVLILGANGSGKTTLCAVLRSLESGDPSHLTLRKTLGVEDPPTVDLLLSDGPVRFDGEAWSTTYPDIAIFDEVFVDENVHSEHVVEIDQGGSLYRVIFGEEGVRLVKEDALLAAKSRHKASEIIAAEGVILSHVPRGRDLTGFLGLLPLPDVDDLIAEQERIVAAVSRAKQISERAALAPLDVPTTPEDLARVLARPMDEVALASESHLADHLAKHDMGGERARTGETVELHGYLLGVWGTVTYMCARCGRIKALR